MQVTSGSFSFQSESLREGSGGLCWSSWRLDLWGQHVPALLCRCHCRPCPPGVGARAPGARGLQGALLAGSLWSTSCPTAICWLLEALALEPGFQGAHSLRCHWNCSHSPSLRSCPSHCCSPTRHYWNVLMPLAVEATGEHLEVRLRKAASLGFVHCHCPHCR